MLRALSGTLSNSSSVVRLHEIGIDKTPRAQESAGNMLAAMSEPIAVAIAHIHADLR